MFTARIIRCATELGVSDARAVLAARLSSRATVVGCSSPLDVACSLLTARITLCVRSIRDHGPFVRNWALLATLLINPRAIDVLRIISGSRRSIAGCCGSVSAGGRTGGFD
ncbi:hypothetical protein ACFVH4_10490 [Nocardia ignorata]|uniref:hypothetical protein n=1 Tax=Nocardia ignorata TaxID=145285 RepID=UPI0036401DB0